MTIDTDHAFCASCRAEARDSRGTRAPPIGLVIGCIVAFMVGASFFRSCLSERDAALLEAPVVVPDPRNPEVTRVR